MQLLPELGVTLYEAAPRAEAQALASGAELTGRQLRAVVELAHHGSMTMGEFADGVEVAGTADPAEAAVARAGDA